MLSGNAPCATLLFGSCPKTGLYRPFIILVEDQETEFICTAKIQDERPTPEIVLETLFKTMQDTGEVLSKREVGARLAWPGTSAVVFGNSSHGAPLTEGMSTGGDNLLG